MTIFIRALVNPDTKQQLTPEELSEQILTRREIIRKYRNHELMLAFTQMLELQAARLTMEAMQPNVANRENVIGQANGVSYIAALLQAIQHAENPEEVEE